MLMALGHGFGNSGQLRTYQPDAQRQTWRFKNDGTRPLFTTELPNSIETDVALTLELTSTIEAERVVSANPKMEMPIARLSTQEPSRDLVGSAETIEDFRIAAQGCLTRLENMMSRSATIHVFPSMPASLAFVFGTVIQPKASNTIRIYDARGHGGPFFETLDLPLRDSEIL